MLKTTINRLYIKGGKMNNQVLKLNNPNSYYKHRETLMRLGLEDPMSDKDERYNKIWNYIVSNNLSIKIVSNYDFERKAPRTEISSSSFRLVSIPKKQAKYKKCTKCFTN